MTTRQEANRELVNILEEIIEKQPQLRFSQILYAYNFIKNNDGTLIDEFYLESKKLLERVNEQFIKEEKMKFNVGDNVFSANYGWGKVVSILECGDYPVVVEFDSTEEYDLDGKFYKEDFLPTLLTKEEAAIKYPEHPCPKKTKKGWLHIHKNIANRHFEENKPQDVAETEYCFEVEVDA